MELQSDEETWLTQDLKGNQLAPKVLKRKLNCFFDFNIGGQIWLQIGCTN